MSRPLDDIPYGGDVTDADLRLLAPVDGNRVLVLGARYPHAAVRFAELGAHVLLVEPDADRHARAEREAGGARIEWHDDDFASLAFIRADTIDLAFSAGVLDEVDDLPRLLRQLHRVLRPGGTLVVAYQHPLARCIDDGTLARAWGADAAATVERDGGERVVHPRTLADVFMALVRTGFRVDALAEPPDGSSRIPAALVWRARKEGV